MVGYAGSRLLTDLAEATGLEFGFVDALASLRHRAGGHALGRVVVDLAVTLVDGGEAISDLAVLRDQAESSGPVASDPAAWQVLKSTDAAAIARLRGARAAARGLAWAQCAETRGALPQAKAAGRGKGHDPARIDKVLRGQCGQDPACRLGDPVGGRVDGLDLASDEYGQGDRRVVVPA